MKKKSLYSRIILLYFIGMVTLIVICLLSFAAISNKLFKDQNMNFCEDLTRLNLNILNGKLNAISDIEKSVATDTRVKSIIEYRNNNHKVDYSVELYNQRSMDEKIRLLKAIIDVEEVTIINKNGKVLYSSMQLVDENRLFNEKWFIDIRQKADMGIPYLSEIHKINYFYGKATKHNKKSISIVVPINAKNENLVFAPSAYIICDLNIDSLLHYKDTDLKFALVDYGSFYSIGKIENENKIKEVVLPENDKDENFHKVGNTMVVSLKTRFNELELVGMKELSELSALQDNMILLTLTVLIIGIILTFLFSKKISMIIMAPINRLMDSCKKVSNGDYNTEFKDENIIEIDVLSKTTENMIESIVSLRDKMVREEKELSKEKLRALQHQINPHFINNVLQSIKALSISGETDKISAITTYLGKVMSYSIYRPFEMVTLKDELNHVKNYLAVQNLRYDNKISYSIIEDEAVMNIVIPKLTLQPIVENAIVHGLKPRERGFIDISVEIEESIAYIFISDNGKGMKKQFLDNIKSNLGKELTYVQENSIGILNVNERIKRIFGTEYGIDIISKEEHGTTVIIKIPKKGRERI